MSMIEAFIKNLDKINIAVLEVIESQWFCTDKPERGIILCAIINEKLRRYEKEY